MTVCDSFGVMEMDSNVKKVQSSKMVNFCGDEFRDGFESFKGVLGGGGELRDRDGDEKICMGIDNSAEENVIGNSKIAIENSKMVVENSPTTLTKTTTKSNQLTQKSPIMSLSPLTSIQASKSNNKPLTLDSTTSFAQSSLYETLTLKKAKTVTTIIESPTIQTLNGHISLKTSQMPIFSAKKCKKIKNPKNHQNNFPPAHHNPKNFRRKFTQKIRKSKILQI